MERARDDRELEQVFPTGGRYCWGKTGGKISFRRLRRKASFATGEANASAHQPATGLLGGSAP